MRLAGEYIRPSAHFLETLAVDFEGGLAAQDHSQDFTPPLSRLVGFTGCQFKKAKSSNLQGLKEGC